MANINYITPEIKQFFTEYTKDNLPDPLKDEGDKFVPEVLETVQNISLGILKQLIEDASKGKNTHVFTSYILDRGFLGKLSFKTIVDNFCNLTKVKQGSISSEGEYDSYTNAILRKREIMPNVLGEHSVRLYWCPDNQYIYPSQEQLQNISPANHSEKHYRDAVNKEGTDYVLIDSEGNERHFHMLYLNDFTEYFNAAKESGFTESEKLTTNLSIESLENLQQFVYLGTIKNKSLISVIELLNYAHMTQMNKLYDTMLNQMTVLLKTTPLLNCEEICLLIDVGYMYNLEDMKKYALSAAEELEKDSAVNSMNWMVIPANYHPELLAIASKNGLEKTTGKLIEILQGIINNAITDINEVEVVE
ncbi:MAG: BTB/POZ domain-containing protein [Chlamydiales bacterium]|nr:BTB/POZ domain-containing protein [Chlamydiales bacterium]